jgi:hypothetical protein
LSSDTFARPLAPVDLAQLTHDRVTLTTTDVVSQD